MTDTCDKCGPAVAAKGSAIKENGQGLTFCGHHLNQYEVLLMMQGFAVARTERD